MNGQSVRLAIIPFVVSDKNRNGVLTREQMCVEGMGWILSIFKGERCRLYNGQGDRWNSCKSAYLRESPHGGNGLQRVWWKKSEMQP